MTYLELCVKLRQESGISGSGPSTTVGQTGILKKICDWVNDAWMDIQSMRTDWDWMYNEDDTFNTVAGTRTYALSDFGISDFGVWDLDAMRCFLTSDGKETEYFLTPVDWRDFKVQYGLGSPDNSTPKIFTEIPNPAGSIRFGVPPDAVYTITGNWWSQATRMTADADVPGLKLSLHDVIWAKALIDYAAHDEAITLYQHNTVKAQKWLNRLYTEVAPSMSIDREALV